MTKSIRHARSDSPECAGGFTYMGILIFVALLGIFLAGTGMVWSTQKQRGNERELLFVGDQYRRAIGQYYERSQGAKHFPKTIDELLLDGRYATVQRYLRRPYFDPVTGQAEWGQVSGPEGGIVGIYSLSERAPRKRGNFKKGYEEFENAEHYSDWKFIYIPGGRSTQQGQKTNPTR